MYKIPYISLSKKEKKALMSCLEDLFVDITKFSIQDIANFMWESMTGNKQSHSNYEQLPKVINYCKHFLTWIDSSKNHKNVTRLLKKTEKYIKKSIKTMDSWATAKVLLYVLAIWEKNHPKYKYTKKDKVFILMLKDLGTIAICDRKKLKKVLPFMKTHLSIE